MTRRYLIVALAVAALALTAGYWLGSRRTSAPPAPATATAFKATPGTPGKILFYRHPMGLPDTSPVPKKDSMGMDYVPVYEGEAPTGPGFVIPQDKLQKLGVRTVEAGPRTLVRQVRAVGTVQVDERRLATISPRFEGYVTRLLVATTGAPVRRGQPLLEVYSPDLVSAQEEFLIARRNLDAARDASPEIRTRLERLVEATRTRLQNWGVAPSDLAAMNGGRTQSSVLLRSPVDGVVLEKMARVGQRFMPGESLYEVASLETVWLVANVFEQDLAALAPGRPAQASFEAYPGRTFAGTVQFVYPTLEAATRTLAVRIEMPNPGGLLKPGLYGSVEIDAPAMEAAVAVPRDAVLDSGTRRVVFVAFPEGRFEAREVTPGASAGGWTAIESGLAGGESVVLDGNFLIDAESNLRAGAAAFGHSHGAASSPETPKSEAMPADSGSGNAGEHEGMPGMGTPAAASPGHAGHSAPTER